MKILLTGATGLIGSRFEELLFEKHEIIPLSGSLGVDITDKDSIEKFLEGKSYDAVIHLAAKTDVDGSELDKEQDLKTLGISEDELLTLDISSYDVTPWKGSKTAVAINAIGTKNLYDITKKTGAKFIYISTDFVFSGKDSEYEEESIPNPVDWYGMSKYLGEKVINQSSDLIIRISFPYGHISPVKKDFVWRLHDLIASRDEVSLISDQTITPTFIDDVVMGIDFLLEHEICGIVHLTGSSSHSPKEISEKIKQTFGLSTSIGESKLEDVYAGKAARPVQSIMKNDKLKNLGFVPKTFDQGLDLIK